MGDPKKRKKQYFTPGHPWQKNRLDQENELAVEYGLKNKKEIWKMNSIMKKAVNQAKKLVTGITTQAEKEKQQLLTRLKREGLLVEAAVFDDILNLTPKNVLERRLQTFICRKGFARTMKQARQFIIHGHVQVDGKTVTAPSYIVLVDQEAKITF